MVCHHLAKVKRGSFTRPWDASVSRKGGGGGGRGELLFSLHCYAFHCSSLTWFAYTLLSRILFKFIKLRLRFSLSLDPKQNFERRTQIHTESLLPCSNVQKHYTAKIPGSALFSCHQKKKKCWRDVYFDDFVSREIFDCCASIFFIIYILFVFQFPLYKKNLINGGIFSRPSGCYFIGLNHAQMWGTHMQFDIFPQ